ncbi:S-adenosyl-L-methionine-dependent methyltransferase [Glomus cerebriforme]|uniref:Ubiquinone biosynthesis O-methyltransferase, mitochondrial n=1 Tax=Glomus cerebriforme TaxID=658196 RepID=A0A397SFR7_9GLOM|nr:S-adenosyl-L-methionine-dependent methyltransferase [Glomus cerebriforme]RIA85073.1 S-adenosyl-L-methionine-dependent methyltransferase [Glomus cerebriforme]
MSLIRTVTSGRQLFKPKYSNIYGLNRKYYRAEQTNSSNPSSSPPEYSTINESEVSKFGQLANEWWSPNGPLKLLHTMNQLRISYIREQLIKNNYKGVGDDVSSSLYHNHHHPFRGLRMLDIGCGGGVLTEALVRLGGSVVGADASDESIKIAQLHAKKDPSLHIIPGNLKYQCITAEKLLEQGEMFDVVCAMEIIEHVNNPMEFLKACAGLVKPGGGHLFLSTISRTPLSYLLTILLAENIFNLVPQGTHDFQKYLRPDELQKVVEEKNNDDQWGKVKDITGIGLNPITGKWYKLPDWIPGKLDVNYLLTAQRF